MQKRIYQLGLAFALCLMMATVASSEEYTEIIFQDAFDNDGLASIGLGGGFANKSIKGGANWSDNGNAIYNNSGVNFDNGAVLYSTNVFQSTIGFQLTVDYTISAIGSQLGNEFSFGLVSTDTDWTSYTQLNPFKNATNAYGVGVNLTARGGTDKRGLIFADGSGSTTLDESGTSVQFPINVSTPVVITILPGGEWSYSINGTNEASGTIAGGFDLNKSYRCIAFGEDNEYTKSIQSLKLDAVIVAATSILIR